MVKKKNLQFLKIKSMEKIYVGIFDEHKLLQEGISELIENTDGIEVVLKENSLNNLHIELKRKIIHILIVNFYKLNSNVLELISHFNLEYPKVKILIISPFSDEKIILKIIKAGAKGFLAKDSNKKNLIEAIYTLRNGYDYFSESITNILLKKYISNLKNENNSIDINNNIKNLSKREIEILKFWGNSYSNKEISEKLFISIRTVESHKNHIMQKLSLKTAVDMVKYAIKNNIIEI